MPPSLVRTYGFVLLLGAHDMMEMLKNSYSVLHTFPNGLLHHNELFASFCGWCDRSEVNISMRKRVGSSVTLPLRLQTYAGERSVLHGPRTVR